MERVPILWNGAEAGELTLERDGLYTWLTARCRVPEGLWCAWAVGDRGELRLGVLEPEDGGASIRRRCSPQAMAPLGTVLRGEVRPILHEEADWERLPEPERPWLRRQLRGERDVWRRREGDRISLAIPYDKGKPFPLPPLFCFAQICPVRETLCAVFTFDREGRPLFP